eukprot:7635621-Pyramimonas_sp.AAC.1
MQKRKNGGDFVLLIRSKDANGKDIQVTSFNLKPIANDAMYTRVLDKLHSIATDYAEQKIDKATAQSQKNELEADIKKELKLDGAVRKRPAASGGGAAPSKKQATKPKDDDSDNNADAAADETDGEAIIEGASRLRRPAAQERS